MLCYVAQRRGQCGRCGSDRGADGDVVLVGDVELLEARGDGRDVADRQHGAFGDLCDCLARAQGALRNDLGGEDGVLEPLGWGERAARGIFGRP
jgi:hypothetical protein